MLDEKEQALITNGVREVAKKYIAPMPREKLVALVLLASSRIGSQKLEKEPESGKESAETLELGLQVLLDMYDKARHGTPLSTDVTIMSPTVGHA